MPAEDRWTGDAGLAATGPEAIVEEGGTGAAPGSDATPCEVMEGSSSGAAPHEIMEGDGFGAAPDEMMEGSDSGAVPVEMNPLPRSRGRA